VQRHFAQRIDQNLKSSALEFCVKSRKMDEEGEAMTGSAKVYELRVYHALPGRLESLVARFRDHTEKLFAKHGMKSLAYWTALDEPSRSSTLVYILEHPSREAATANWKAFQDDPEWKKVRANSEENGKIVEKIDSTFLTLTDFSRL
jgi:hypothetical protein